MSDLRLDIGSHHANLAIPLIQIVHHDVSEGNYAPKLAPLADRQVPETMAVHELAAIIHRGEWFHRKWLIRHDFRDQGF
jgi:hypothetical protein